MQSNSTFGVGPAIPSAIRGEVRSAAGPDGAPLHFRYWAAPGARDAAVYLHGIAGHSLWFSPAATRLVHAGITVYGPDRRGSGLNRGLGAGDLADYRGVLRDVLRFVELARAEHPAGRVFLLAGCWGAKAGAVFAARMRDGLDGLALIAPALSVRVKLPLVDLVGVAASLVGRPERYFRIPLQPEQYTENPRFRAFVAADPQRLLFATARFYRETARLDRLAAKAAHRIRLPVLLQLGGRDVIVDLDGTQAWFDRLGSPDKTLRIYPEFAHILEFEERTDEYVADLLAWLHAHAARGSALQTVEQDG